MSLGELSSEDRRTSEMQGVRHPGAGAAGGTPAHARRHLSDDGRTNGDRTTDGPGEASNPRARAASSDPGEAGRSAQREHDRRSARREAEVRDRHPVVGGLLLALMGESQSTRAWAQGAIGERIVGQHLDRLAGQGVVALHDRRVPRSAANIDHIAVSPSGIFVIDAKYRAGRRVEMRRAGGRLHRGARRLVIGGWDAGPMLDTLAWQVAAVRRALHASRAPDAVPLTPMLVIVEAQWGRSTSGLVIGGVEVLWPKAMACRVRSRGPLAAETVGRITECLAERLPPA